MASIKKHMNLLLRRTWNYVNSHRKQVFLFLLFLSAFNQACHLLHRHFVSPPQYSVRNLGVHGPTFEVKVAINNRGNVVGTVLVVPKRPNLPLQNLGFIDRGGTVTYLGTLPGARFSTPVKINDRDEVLGIATYPNGTSTVFLWQNGKMINLGYDAEDLCLNNNGMVAYAIDTPNGSRAIEWQNGTRKVLPTLGGNCSVGAINNQGDIAGNAEDSDGNSCTVLWADGKVRILKNYIKTPCVTVEGINDNQQIVGEIHDDAVIWQGNSISTLGSFGGESAADCINQSGQVVGWSSKDWLNSILDYDTDRHAFLWQKDEFFDLNDYIPPQSGWTLLEATGINDHGQIVGHGLFHDQPCSFLLTPLE